ncbi:universal stress protein [Deinococcus hopiensis]|uniref:Universal stress protein n=1 Tax=Deinococcus hopiensis KR-140 TaxID=695939 RepID=A0A1W1UNK2_9DEIO|nr:universal stress protein [Deinococcus hopiensis]SMB82708.1 Nucleotide-binding universal stress protein, UspA family [Deinococcus hopiensis KR-140]
MQYQRILVATGGAPHSEKAVERAIALAVHFGATLDIVAVIPIGANVFVNIAAGMPGAGKFEEQQAQDEHQLRGNHLQQVAAVARERGLLVHEHLLQGIKPADAILGVARDVGADLIVMGRRHTTAFSAAMAGSTGDAVSHAATTDVLIAR